MIPLTKTLMLGTAQWGWTVSKSQAFRILDAWFGAGFRHIDCATNYPINRNPADFRAAEKILLEYTLAHGLRDLRLSIKVGSLDNLRSPDINLAPSFVQMMGAEYLRLFDSNLACIMFHWDNREDVQEIRASLEALQRLQKEHGIQPGISGIAHPEAYAEANADLNLCFEIQLKHNVLQSDFERYAALFAPQLSGSLTPKESGLKSTKSTSQPIHERERAITPKRDQSTSQPVNQSTNQPVNQSTLPIRQAGNHQLYAYGLNAGGAKLEAPYPADSTFLARGGQPDKVAPLLEKISKSLPGWNTAFVRPPVKTMNHIGLIYAGLHPGLSGILLGVSSEAQLRETLDFWRNLETFDYTDVYSALKKILLRV